MNTVEAAPIFKKKTPPKPEPKLEPKKTSKPIFKKSVSKPSPTVKEILDKTRRPAKIKDAPSFEDATSLIPEVIAGAISDEVLKVLPGRFRQSKLLISHLSQRLKKTYDSNDDFAKKLRGAKGRDLAYVFMRHWATSYIKKNWSDSDAKALGPDFAKGIEIKAPPPKPSGQNLIKSWTSKDKTAEINLVSDDGFYEIHMVRKSASDAKARMTSTSTLPKAKNDKDAIVEWEKVIKNIVDPKTKNIRKTEVKSSFKDEKLMNTDDKLSILSGKNNKKVVKKKRNSKQILNSMKATGKKILKTEARIKGKIENLRKDLAKLQEVKKKHHDRMKKYIGKLKDKQAKKAGAVSVPSVPPTDVSSAKPKKK